MTSANVKFYEVYKDGKLVAEHRQNCLCKMTIVATLQQYTPASEYKLRLRWPDEEEANHYSQKMRLDRYLAKTVHPIWDGVDYDE